MFIVLNMYKFASSRRHKHFITKFPSRSTRDTYFRKQKYLQYNVELIFWKFGGKLQKYKREKQNWKRYKSRQKQKYKAERKLEIHERPTVFDEG